jgi:hypothetical protein
VRASRFIASYYTATGGESQAPEWPIFSGIFLGGREQVEKWANVVYRLAMG